MRLTILDRGHRWRARLFIAALSRLSRVEMSDVPKTMLYRPEFVGRAMLDLAAEAMRGPSFWSAGEREYLAAHTAALHQCPYCVTSHTELTRIASGGEIDAGDPGSVRPELRAVLPFIEKVTRTPELVSASDLDAKLPEHAIVDALHVNLVFNVVSRLANAFDFTLSEGQLEQGTRSLHRFGYRLPRFVTGGKMVTEDVAIEQLRHPVRSSPAAADLPEPLRSYARMVRDESYRVSDADIARLRTAGHSEDEIFEVTVTATVGAALRSLDAGITAVSQREGETMSTKPNPIPDSYRRVTPCLVVNGGAAAIDFYIEVFQATERMRFPGPDGTIAHAEIQIGDSVVMIEDTSPDRGTKAPPAGGTPSAFQFIYVEDVDAVIDHAVKLGAKLVRPAQDQFYGDRDGYIIDPFGHGWTIASHVEDVTEEEMGRRMAEMMGQS